MLFVHFKRILKLDRLRLKGPTGAHDELLLAATAQNLRKLAKPPKQNMAPTGSTMSLGSVWPRGVVRDKILSNK